MQHLIGSVLQKHRDRAVLAVLILLSLTLLIFPQNLKLDIARGALDALLAPVQRWTLLVEDYSGVRSENERLRRMVATLMLERERLMQFRDERERLRRMAAFKEEHFYRLVPAEVIGRSLDRLRSTLVIDKGEGDSLRVRMPVFSYQGLAGRLSHVFEKSARVQLIASRNYMVSCVDKRSRVVGTLQWLHGNLFELADVSVVEDVAAGDTLITSGFGGVVPKGFPVAVVTRVIKESDGLSLRVEARATVKFSSLEEVFVMTDEIPWDRAVFYEEADTLMMRDILLHQGEKR